MQLPTDAQFFSREDPSKPDIAFLKNHFYREGRIKEEHALYIIQKATEILRSEPNLLTVEAPVTGACHQLYAAGMMLTSSFS
jgi:serine/threonine-protein phosphatase 2B catalytic subunit